MNSIVNRVWRYSRNRIKFLQLRAHQKQGVKIVHWHGVGEDNIFIKGSKASISTGIFKEQVKYIKKHYSVISLIDFIKSLKSGTLLSHSVVLTFDDCYRNLLLNAIPILIKYKLPSTIFVNSSFVGNKQLPWWVKLAYIVNIGEGKLLYDSFQDRLIMKSLDSDYGYDNLRSIALQNNTLQIDRICDGVLENLGISNLELAQNANLFWNPDDFLTVNKNLISFGNHTATHPILSILDPENQYREIYQGKEFLTKKLGIESPPFAVPNGRVQDLGNIGERIVRETGHSCLLYAYGGTNDKTSDRFHLKRKMIPPLNGRLFAYFLEDYEPS